MSETKQTGLSSLIIIKFFWFVSGLADKVEAKQMRNRASPCRAAAAFPPHFYLSPAPPSALLSLRSRTSHPSTTSPPNPLANSFPPSAPFLAPLLPLFCDLWKPSTTQRHFSATCVGTLVMLPCSPSSPLDHRRHLINSS